MSRAGCIVSRSLRDSRLGAWLASGYGAGQEPSGGCCSAPTSLLCPQGHLLPWGAPHSPSCSSCSWGGGGGLLWATLHPCLAQPRHSWGLCSIAALAVAVGGLGHGVSPALLHASFGPFCGPSEFLCSLWDPCDPLCCLEHLNCRLWGPSTFPVRISAALLWLLLLLPGPLWEKCPCTGTAGVSSTV